VPKQLDDERLAVAVVLAEVAKELKAAPARRIADRLRKDARVASPTVAQLLVNYAADFDLLSDLPGRTRRGPR